MSYFVFLASLRPDRWFFPFVFILQFSCLLLLLYTRVFTPARVTCKAHRSFDIVNFVMDNSRTRLKVDLSGFPRVGAIFGFDLFFSPLT